MPVTKKCVNKNCLVNLLPNKERGTLFCFPRDDNLRVKWLQNMNRMDLHNLTYSQLHDRGYRVCPLHFDDGQFQNHLKLRLNFGQVPRPVQDANIPDNLENPVEDLREGGNIPSASSSENLDNPVIPPTSYVENLGNPEKDDISQIIPPTSTSENSVELVKETIPSPLTATIFGPTSSKFTTSHSIENTERSGSPEHRLTLKDLGVSRMKDLTPRKNNLYRRLQASERLLRLSRNRGRALTQKFKDIN